MTRAIELTGDAQVEWVKQHIPALDEWQVWTFGRRGRKCWMLSTRVTANDDPKSELWASKIADEYRPTCWAVCVIHVQASPR